MKELYTVAEASKATGIARPTLRAYTNRYSTYLSTEATPEQGAERSFTLADLRTLAFVYSLTSANRTHEQVLQALSAGELERFDWQPAEEPAQRTEGAESASEALVPVSRLQAAQLLVQDAQQREKALADQLEEARAEMQRLGEELGKARGELQGFKSAQYRAPAWWRSLFGGRASE